MHNFKINRFRHTISNAKYTVRRLVFFSICEHEILIREHEIPRKSLRELANSGEIIHRIWNDLHTASLKWPLILVSTLTQWKSILRKLTDLLCRIVGSNYHIVTAINLSQNAVLVTVVMTEFVTDDLIGSNVLSLKPHFAYTDIVYTHSYRIMNSDQWFHWHRSYTLQILESSPERRRK